MCSSDLVEVGEPPEDALEYLLEVEQALERVDRRARLGLAELGVKPTPIESVIPSYLDRFRPGGRFSAAA